MLISKNHELCDISHGEKIFVIVGEGADYGMKFSVSVHLDRRSPTEKPAYTMTPCKQYSPANIKGGLSFRYGQ
jgi:hypothetical protein